MVGLVVDNYDVLFVAEFEANPANHFVRLLLERIEIASMAGKYLFGERSSLKCLPTHEGVEIGDQYPCLLKRLELIRCNQVPLNVVVIGIVRLQDPESVPDCDAGGHDQKGVAEATVLGVRQLIEDMPSDQHCHDDRLPGPGGHFEGNAV